MSDQSSSTKVEDPEPPAPKYEPVKSPPEPAPPVIEKEPFNKFQVKSQGFSDYQYDSNQILDGDFGHIIEKAAQYEKEDLEEANKVYESSVALSSDVDKYVKAREDKLQKDRETAERNEKAYLDKYFSKPTQQTVKPGDKPPPLTSFVPTEKQITAPNDTTHNTSSHIQFQLNDSYIYYDNRKRNPLRVPDLPDEYIHIPKKYDDVPKYVEKPSNKNRKSDAFFLWLHPSSYKIKIAIAIIISFIFIIIAMLFGWLLISYLQDKSAAANLPSQIQQK